MGFVELVEVGYSFPGGRTLFDRVSFKVGDGHRVALVGANGVGQNDPRQAGLFLATSRLAPSRPCCSPGDRHPRRARPHYGDGHTATVRTGQGSGRPFEKLSGGQQARLQILVLEVRGSTRLLLDEPTDNLDVASADALEYPLWEYQGTILAVTHDRWLLKSFQRFLVFGSDGSVVEGDEPAWR